MEGKSVFYRAFVRDNGSCVYCGKNMMSSFDSFAQIQLDHLKPKKTGGEDEDVDNRVISCFVCNNLKGAYDPMPHDTISPSNREFYISSAKEFISGKRNGNQRSTLYDDYRYWLNEFNSIKS